MDCHPPRWFLSIFQELTSNEVRLSQIDTSPDSSRLRKGTEFINAIVEFV